MLPRAEGATRSKAQATTARMAKVCMPGIHIQIQVMKPIETRSVMNQDWVKIPVFDDRGRPLQQRGVTAVPGLYFLGLHWMHTFKSGLLSGVGADAEFLADHMARCPPA